MSKKGDPVYRALQRLMAEPGSHSDIYDELLSSLDADSPNPLVAAVANLSDYSDHVAAIVFGAMLEQSLEAALSTHFVISPDKLSSVFSYPEEGPFAALASKIKLGLALGVYDERMRDDLRWISRVRNAFAHIRVRIDFNTKEIADACNELIYPKLIQSGLFKTPRQRFVGTVGMLSLYLRRDTKTPIRFAGNPLYEALYPAPSA